MSDELKLSMACFMLVKNVCYEKQGINPKSYKMTECLTEWFEIYGMNKTEICYSRYVRNDERIIDDKFINTVNLTDELFRLNLMNNRID